MKRSHLVLVPAINRLTELAPAVLYEVAAAKYVKIDIAKFRALVATGKIPAMTHHGRTRKIYFREDLDRYVRGLPVVPADGGKMPGGESPSEPPH